MGSGSCLCCKKKQEPMRDPSLEVVTIRGRPVVLDESCFKDLKSIYKFTISAMQNFLGTPCYPYITQPNQLYPYILHLCEGLEDHEYVALKNEMSNFQITNVQLTVTVKEANVIHPKITEFSRMFCKLWIKNGEDVHTVVRESSTVLLWDERFQLDVEDQKSDVFHFEIWSLRPNFVGRLTAYTYNLKEDDPLAENHGMYFIGDAVEYIKLPSFGNRIFAKNRSFQENFSVICLPCVGQNVTWTLKRGPRRSQTVGQINLFLELISQKEDNFILHFHCHMAILRLSFEKQLLTSKESAKIWKNWLEILPNPAVTLLQQHAIQHGITPIEQCLSSWLVSSSLKMRFEDRISFCLMNDLMENLLKNVSEDSIGPLYSVFLKSISDFADFTVELLEDLHQLFDVQNTEKADELFYMLRCMNMTKRASLVECSQYIEEEASQWYLKVISEMKGALEEDESINKLGDGLKLILKAYLRNQILLDDVFGRAWNVSYTSITRRKLDSVVCTTIKPMIEHLIVMLNAPNRNKKISESLKMLQLYHTARNLVNYITTIVPSESGILRMDDYSNWFGEEMVLEWFLLCDLFTEPFIRRAVYADSMERINSKIVHGTSVPDVSSIIDEMVIGVWVKLSWKEKFYTHGALIEAVKTCVLTYCDAIQERLVKEKLYCSKKMFVVNKKLCVALSNVFAISQHLCRTKRKIKLELKACETALGFKISNPLFIAQSGLQSSASNICLSIFKRIFERAKELMYRAVQSEVDVSTEGSPDICLYVDNSLEVLYRNMQPESFYILLQHLWIVLLKTMKHGLSYAKMDLCSFRGFFVTPKKRKKIFLTVLQILKQMKNIVHSNENGLYHYEMENIYYEELKTYLETKLEEN